MDTYDWRRRKRNPGFADLVDELRQRQEPPSINQLHRTTGLTNGMLTKLLDGYQPTWKAVYEIAKAYPDKAEDLFRVAGYPFPVDLVPEFTKVVSGDGPTPEELENAIRRLLEGVKG